jgi:hypothetical protein
LKPGGLTYTTVSAPEKIASGSHRGIVTKIFFDATPLTNIDVPVFNVFRKGANTFWPVQILDQPKWHKPKSDPDAMSKLPPGCESSISSVASRDLSTVPVVCLTSRDGDVRFAVL